MSKKAINMLKGILDWSDRIGSDETNEIEEIIKELELSQKETDNNNNNKRYRDGSST